MKLQDSILQKMRDEKISPIPKRYFIFKKIFQIFFFVLILSFGIILSSIFFTDFSENRDSFQIRYIMFPIVWITLIALVGVFGFYDIRQIGRMYRYSLFAIFSTLFLAFVVWWLLNYRLGIGHTLQRYIVGVFPQYDRLTLRTATWTDTAQGKLAGAVMEMVDSRTYTIRDLRGEMHTIVIPTDMSLSLWEDIRLLWEIDSQGIFAVSSKLPWFWSGSWSQLHREWNYRK